MGGGATYKKLEGSAHTLRTIENAEQRILDFETDLAFYENSSRRHCGGHGPASYQKVERMIDQERQKLEGFRIKLAKQLDEEARDKEKKKLEREARVEELVWDGMNEDQDVVAERERRHLQVTELGQVRGEW